ncbi:F-box protein PP2-A11-like isoform X1 [Actinidia eriantha]|uniref:F-box protein PP2-A11-like isoform X1 n=1 Tax=Actinidia eriantha TaxID=165200 RepID=UPI0025843E5B|nr:F-box protein PP2-A11-like isoform X1 [Actinidia eriantha]
MGVGYSGLLSDTELVPGLGNIPESCAARVLGYLDPPEICKLGRLNRAFRQASWADCVWESKLPENYQCLVKKLFDENPEDLCKRDIFERLCSPNRFDGGTKEVWMEKRSGGICVSISWQGMKIIGIDDRRYWNHIASDESRRPTELGFVLCRFHTIAYLQQIWWVEVDGNLEFQFPSGTYSLYFRLRLGQPKKRLGWQISNLDQVHGWDIKPVRFQFSTSNGHQGMTQCYLSEPGKWVHYHVGDFVVENPNSQTKIKFSMTQIDCTHTKGGLCLDSVIILPKLVVL